MRVGYVSLGSDSLGYGMALCLSRLKRHRHVELFQATWATAKDADWLLFGVPWWEQIYALADRLRAFGIKKSDDKRPRILIGGSGIQNPKVAIQYADYCCFGDGEEAIEDLIIRDIKQPYIYTGQETIIEYGVCESIPPFIVNGKLTARIEIARGCKYRCKFCHVSHVKPYREVSINDFAKALRLAKRKSISAFAPNPTKHREYTAIRSLCTSSGKTLIESDARLDDDVAAPSSMAKIGLEGLSERLRESVGKRYSDAYVRDRIVAMAQRGGGGMYLYIILDLPGERPSDYEAFAAMLETIRATYHGQDRISLYPGPNMFAPMPLTPMQREAISWDVEFSPIWSTAMGRLSWSDSVVVGIKHKIQRPASRVLGMLAIRGGEDFAEIEATLSAAKTIRVSDDRPACRWGAELSLALQPYGGPERFCGYLEGDLPWAILKPPVPVGTYTRPE